MLINQEKFKKKTVERDPEIGPDPRTRRGFDPENRHQKAYICLGYKGSMPRWCWDLRLEFAK
jgi:hypothetical protein